LETIDHLIKSQQALIKAMSMLTSALGSNWQAQKDFSDLLGKSARHIRDAIEQQKNSSA
jgi:hypothetical protein